MVLVSHYGFYRGHLLNVRITEQNKRNCHNVSKKVSCGSSWESWTLLHGTCTQTQQLSMFQGVQSTNSMEISFSSVIMLKNCEILTIISIGDIAKLLKKMKISFLCKQEQPSACCAAQVVSAA